MNCPDIGFVVQRSSGPPLVITTVFALVENTSDSQTRPSCFGIDGTRKSCM